MKTALVLLSTVVSLSSATARAADYAADGPLTTTVTALPAAQGGANGGKLVVPGGAGPYPLLIAAHGFSANSDNQVGWATHFASYGFVVVVPNFAGTDHAANGKVIEALLALYADPTTDSPAKGKVDATHPGLEGHSAGGLASALAAAATQPGATVLFDPVDNGDLGKQAMPQVAGPVLEIFAAPSSCNSSSGWSAFKTASTGPQVFFSVNGSTHCDGENADRGVLCGLVCGGAAAPARQARYAHYATAFFLAFLKSDSAAAAELCAAKLGADTTIAGGVSSGVPGCASAPLPDLGAGAADLGARPADAGVPGPGDGASGSPPGGGGNHGSGGAGGCALGAPRVPAAFPWSFAPLFALLLRRRRGARRAST